MKLDMVGSGRHNSVAVVEMHTHFVGSEGERPFAFAAAAVVGVGAAAAAAVDDDAAAAAVVFHPRMSEGDPP